MSSTPISSLPESSTQVAKRKLLEVLPECLVGNMSLTDLMKAMTKILDERLEKLLTKEDLDEIIFKINNMNEKVNELSIENQNLKEDIAKLKKERLEDHRHIMLLEEQIKSKNLIFKGVPTNKSAFKAVVSILKEKLKIKKRVEIANVKKVQESNKKMTVLVEMRSSYMVRYILRHAKNLSGSSIYIDRDLNCDQMQHKKLMLQLKKDILHINKSKKIKVLNNKLLIDGNWFMWNNKDELVCGEEKAEVVLKSIYGDSISNVNIEIKNVISRINAKN